MTDAKEGMKKVAEGIEKREKEGEKFMKDHITELAQCEPAFLEVAVSRRQLPPTPDENISEERKRLLDAATHLDFPYGIEQQVRVQELPPAKSKPKKIKPDPMTKPPEMVTDKEAVRRRAVELLEKEAERRRNGL